MKFPHILRFLLFRANSGPNTYEGDDISVHSTDHFHCTYSISPEIDICSTYSLSLLAYFPFLPSVIPYRFPLSLLSFHVFACFLSYFAPKWISLIKRLLSTRFRVLPFLSETSFRLPPSFPFPEQVFACFFPETRFRVLFPLPKIGSSPVHRTRSNNRQGSDSTNPVERNRQPLRKPTINSDSIFAKESHICVSISFTGLVDSK